MSYWMMSEEQDRIMIIFLEDIKIFIHEKIGIGLEILRSDGNCPLS